MSNACIITQSELRALQLVLLDMLMEIDHICTKHNIRYVIDGGTLLGAVRHGGFIPWDDDLDIVMTREEYERFRKICVKELDSEKYFFQDETTDSEYRWEYGKLRRKGSEFIRLGQEHLKMQTGIFLDVFPRDNVPNGKIARIAHNAYCFILRKILYSEVGKKTSKTPILRFVYRILSLIPTTLVFKLLENMRNRLNKSKTYLMRTYCFPILHKRQYGYKREWFVETSSIMFEGATFKCPKDYNGYLTCLYDDYMTIPPPEKRHWHPAAKFSLPGDSDGE